MSARILVVDDIEANVRLLQAKLQRAYYDVITATRGEEAVQLARREKPDIILLDVMMPGITGFEACARLKSLRETRHIPVVLVTTLDGREDRLRGLQSGTEDFLTKPIDDVQLMARVKPLARLKMLTDELRAREESGMRLGVIAEELRPDPLEKHRIFSGEVLVVDDHERQIGRIAAALSVEHRVWRLGDADAASVPDLVIVSLCARGFDGCKVIARMRASEAARIVPILAIFDPDRPDIALKALELGAHDVIARPLDEDELVARARTLLRHKHYVDALRRRLDQSMELAVIDQLTGLYNRRFLMSQLEPLVQRASCGGAPCSVLLADIDHFKSINDRFGHDAGDIVLKEFSSRLASNTRPVDYACRLGGEEFVVIMTGTPAPQARHAAERLRRLVADHPFNIGADDALDVTVSIGVAQSGGSDDSAEAILKRADEGLYDAKRSGRNRVIEHAA
jgi:two-component system cell cycle response regulator